MANRKTQTELLPDNALPTLMSLGFPNEMTGKLVSLVICFFMSSVFGNPLHDAVDPAYDTKRGRDVTWPQHTKWTQKILVRGEYQGFYAENNDLNQGEHAGTHLDAPSHFIKGSWRLHEIPMERFTGEAVVIDIRYKTMNNSDATLDMEDLISWEERYGRIPKGAIMVMYSGWGQFSNDTVRYLGVTAEDYAANPKDWTKLHFPGFSGEAARFLAEERDIHGMAVDSPSADPGSGGAFPAHHHLLGKKIWILENTANVDQLSPNGHTIFAVPYNIHDGSGAPTRAFALPTSVFNKHYGSGGAQIKGFWILPLISFIHTFAKC